MTQAIHNLMRPNYSEGSAPVALTQHLLDLIARIQAIVIQFVQTILPFLFRESPTLTPGKVEVVVQHQAPPPLQVNRLPVQNAPERAPEAAQVIDQLLPIQRIAEEALPAAVVEPVANPQIGEEALPIENNQRPLADPAELVVQVEVDPQPAEVAQGVADEIPAPNEAIGGPVVEADVHLQQGEAGENRMPEVQAVAIDEPVPVPVNPDPQQIEVEPAKNNPLEPAALAEIAQPDVVQDKVDPQQEEVQSLGDNQAFLAAENLELAGESGHRLQPPRNPYCTPKKHEPKNSIPGFNPFDDFRKMRTPDREAAFQMLDEAHRADREQFKLMRKARVRTGESFKNSGEIVAEWSIPSGEFQADEHGKKWWLDVVLDGVLGFLNKMRKRELLAPDHIAIIYKQGLQNYLRFPNWAEEMSADEYIGLALGEDDFTIPNKLLYQLEPSRKKEIREKHRNSLVDRFDPQFMRLNPDIKKQIESMTVRDDQKQALFKMHLGEQLEGRLDGKSKLIYERRIQDELGAPKSAVENENPINVRSRIEELLNLFGLAANKENQVYGGILFKGTTNNFQIYGLFAKDKKLYILKLNEDGEISLLKFSKPVHLTHYLMQLSPKNEGEDCWIIPIKQNANPDHATFPYVPEADCLSPNSSSSNGKEPSSDGDDEKWS